MLELLPQALGLILTAQGVAALVLVAKGRKTP